MQVATVPENYCEVNKSRRHCVIIKLWWHTELRDLVHTVEKA